MSQLQLPATLARIGRTPKQIDIGARVRDLSGARAAAQLIGRATAIQAYEAALVLSMVATAPIRLIRGADESAKHLRPRRITSKARTSPVLLVHGFGGDKSSWALVAQTLSEHGLTVETMSYAPVGNSVEQLADRLVAEVEKTLSRTGAQKAHLVGHSLGGVIIAQAMSDPRLTGRVDTVITLGSPFGGSPWADALPVVDMVRALRPGSPLLRRLASTPLPDGVRWLSVTAALDIIVPSDRSVPPHDRVETVTVEGVGHLGMLLSRRVIACITAALCADATAIAA
jgi:triacylglycerol lipase